MVAQPTAPASATTRATPDRIRRSMLLLSRRTLRAAIPDHIPQRGWSEVGIGGDLTHRAQRETLTGVEPLDRRRLELRLPDHPLPGQRQMAVDAVLDRDDILIQDRPGVDPIVQQEHR